METHPFRPNGWISRDQDSVWHTLRLSKRISSYFWSQNLWNSGLCI